MSVSALPATAGTVTAPGCRAPTIRAPRYGRPPTVLADRRSEVRCVLHLLEIAPARI